MGLPPDVGGGVGLVPPPAAIAGESIFIDHCADAPAPRESVTVTLIASIVGLIGAT